jgi:hypothetical protein
MDKSTSPTTLKMDSKEWIRICEAYDSLSDAERMVLSFEDFCLQNNFEILQ